MKRHIDYIRNMIEEIDSSIKFYEIIPPMDISKLLEENTIACIVKREDDNTLNGEHIFTTFNYTINFISKDISSDILATEENPGLIIKTLRYLNTNIYENDVLIRAGKSGIDTQYVQFGLYILYLTIQFEDFIKN
jgi:hypothetical protein